MAAAVLTAAVILQPFSASAEALDQIRSIAKSIISGEPKEVEELRQMEVAQSEEGHQEYYFKQLTEEEQRVYRGAAERNPCPGKGVLSDNLR